MSHGVLVVEFSGVSPKVKKKGQLLKRAALVHIRLLQKGLVLPMCQNNFLKYIDINKALSRQI